MKSLAVCALSAWLAFSCAARAAEYYVDAESRGGPANDAGPGTKEKPWRTLGRIVGKQGSLPNAGDTVWVRAGTYPETLFLSRGGTAEKPLALKAFPNEKPVIDGENKRYYGVLIEGDGADHIVIEGLAVVNHKPAYSGGTGAIKVLGRADVTIRNVEVSGAWTGVNFTGAQDCKLLQSHIHHNVESNITVANPSCGILIADNQVHHSLEYDCIDVTGAVDGLIQMGKLVSVTPAGPGLARLTVADAAAGGFVMKNLTGRDAGGAVKYPQTPVLFFLSESNPSPDGPEIPGGTFPLMDGRKWFPLRNNPEWGNKPCSPDGKQALFETGQAAMAELIRAKFIYVGNTNDPTTRWSRDIQILRNEVHDSARQGILAPGADGILIQGNKIWHNGATGIQIETGARHVWLDGNVSYGNNVLFGGETGIWTAQDIDVVIQNNILYENQRGLAVSQCHWTLVRRNVIYNNKAQHVPAQAADGCRFNSGGIQFSGGWHARLGAPRGAENCAFVQNTLYGNGADTSFWGSFECGAPGNSIIGANVVLNNLIQDAHGAAALYIGRTMPARLDGNIYQSPGPVRVEYVDSDKAKSKTYDITAAAGLAGYQKATVLDAHSLVAPAAFVNAGAADFHLARGSVAIDKGQPLAKTVAAGEGAAVPVTDVRCFSEGLKTSKGKVLIEGDEIMVAGAKARVIGIDREKKILTLDKKLTWKDGDPVTYIYSGAGPDVGAFESE